MTSREDDTSNMNVSDDPHQAALAQGRTDRASSFRQILVPLDGSHLAESVLPVAARTADAFGAAIVLLHVIERAAPVQVHGERHLRTLAEAEAYLTEIANRLSTAGRHVEYHAHEVPEGDVAKSIAAHVEERHIDLLIVCTHGEGGLRDAIWGSIAQQVLHRSTRPVLLVRATTVQPTPPFMPKTIMVPLDATANAEAAIPPATVFARGLGAELRLVVVVATSDTIPQDQRATATLLPGATRALLDAQEKQASTYLEQFADKIRATGVNTVTEVRRGDAVAELASDTTAHGDGLIVVATHGRAGLQALWSPSVAARLLKRTAMPVLLVPIIERD